MSDTTADSQAYESRSEAFKDARATALYWLNSWQLAGKNEKDWRESAEKATKVYEATKKEAFNILHSNTETIKAAVYNSPPVPDIRPPVW